MNEREHGLMWQARCIAIETMLVNIYGSPLRWDQVSALYRALLVALPPPPTPEAAKETKT